MKRGPLQARLAEFTDHELELELQHRGEAKVHEHTWLPANPAEPNRRQCACGWPPRHDYGLAEE